MKRLLHVSVLLFTLALSPMAAKAQVEPGARVRVTAPGFAKKPIVGLLNGLDENHIRIQYPPCSPRDRALGLCKEPLEVTIPREAVTQLEVSRGRSRRSHQASVGAVTGLAVGAVTGIAAGEDCTPGAWLCFSRGGLGTLLGVTGALLGAGVGAAIAPGEKWEPVGANGVDVSVAPLLERDGMGLAVSFSF